MDIFAIGLIVIVIAALLGVVLYVTHLGTDGLWIYLLWILFVLGATVPLILKLRSLCFV